jgi:hypothetical protein
MSQKIYSDYSDADGVKAMMARELTKLELSRNDMVKSLDIALNMTNEQLNNIIKNLSKNQHKTKFGQALKMIVELKEKHHL